MAFTLTKYLEKSSSHVRNFPFTVRNELSHWCDWAVGKEGLIPGSFSREVDALPSGYRGSSAVGWRDIPFAATFNQQVSQLSTLVSPLHYAAAN